MTQGARLRALVVDDEQAIADLVGGYLREEGFDVQTSGDGTSAVAIARELDPDVIVLDLMLPGIDGIEACRQIRTFSDAYIVMLTARAEELDTLVGLSVGADDYVTKPFSPRELVARIRVMLRRPRRDGPEETSVIRMGEIEIDIDGHEIRRAGAPIGLTPREFGVVAALAARPKMVFTRRQLLDAAWGPDWIGDEHVVDVHIASARRKLGDDPAAPRFIRTVRGVGYRIGPAE